MPTLPSEPSLGQRPNPRPAGGVASYSPTTGMEGAGADALTTSGQALGQAAAAFAVYQHTQDETNANDVYANKFSPAFREMYQSYRQLQGKDAVDQMPQYVEKMQELRKTVRDGLPNSSQQKMFDEYSRRRVEMELDNMAMHSNSQNKVWQVSTHRSNLQNDLSVIADAPADQVSFLNALELGRKHIYDFDKANGGIGIHGMNAAEEFKRFTSDALITKIDGLIFKNPILAQKELSDPATLQMIDPKARPVLQHKAEEAATVAITNSVANVWVNDALKGISEGKPAATVPSRPSFGKPRTIAPAAQAYVPIVESAAEATGVDANILLAQIQQESGGNLMAVSPAGAKGVSQFIPATAKRYGVDVTNAQSSINGQARYMADMLKMFDGDYAKALAGYNMGENEGTPERPGVAGLVKRWGSDWLAHAPAETQNYVKTILGNVGTANATLQDTSGLPNARDVKAQLPILMAKVEPWLNENYGTDTTNPMRIRAAASIQNALASRINKEGAQLDAIQKQSQGELIDAIAGFNGKAPISDFAQLQQDPKLLRAWQMTDPQAKLGLARLIEQNARDDKKENSPLYWEAWNRIHADVNDPQKIDFYQQLLTYAGPGKLNPAQVSQLRQEIDRAETPGGRSPSQMMKGASINASSFFKTNIMFTGQPERALEATVRWTEDAGKKVDEYVKAGKSVRSLFILDSPDSIVSSKYLQTFVNSTPAQALSADATKARAAQTVTAAIQQPATIDTREKLDAWFQTLPSNATTFVGTDGVTRAIPRRAIGTPVSDFVSWMKATGGVLKPGQTQAQAIAEWKGAK